MKIRAIGIIIIFLAASHVEAQVNDLFGTHWSGNENAFVSLDLESNLFNDPVALDEVQTFIHGESTFDPIGNRYFTVTDLGISIVDAESGNLLESIPNPLNFKGIEYEAISNSLFGYYWADDNVIFASLNLVSKEYTDLGILDGVTTYVAGESSFDAENRRYFLVTDIGITIVNVQNGSIIDTIDNPLNIKCIEYAEESNSLFGIYWTEEGVVFVSLDLALNFYTDIGMLSNVLTFVQGESAIDNETGRFFMKTNLGITVVDSESATILDTIENPNNFKGIEFPNSTNPVGIKENYLNKDISFYPNPTTDLIQLRHSNIDDYEFEIFDATGTIVHTRIPLNNEGVIDLSDLVAGVYLVRMVSEEGSLVNYIVKN